MMRGRGASALPLLAPFGIGIALLLVVPALITFGYAFTDHTGFGTPRFSGLGNLRRAFEDPLAAAALRASVLFALLAVPIRLLVAVGAGIALARPRRGARLGRVLVYLPTVIPDVALALVFLWVFNPLYGPVNGVLGAFGLPQPVWLSTAWGARWAIVIMMAFPIGEAFLVTLAARRSLPAETYEAAAVDGASAWQQLRHVTLPQLAPLLVLLAVRDTILSLQVNFVPAYVLTDGGPDAATLFLPVYIFDQAFEFLGFGYGAMLTLVLFVVTGVLITIQALLARRWGWLR
ncbi:MAG: sugar ABC transporter permease [Actinobacteria bacterium]|nr:sugar ABC transporter permease [Actinomycetota bacterium]